MSEELKPCPFCGGESREVTREDASLVYCKKCKRNMGIFAGADSARKYWNTRPIEDEKDNEIDSLNVELNNLRHFCDSILEKAKRNNGVLYFWQDDGTWRIGTGKDNDVPANDTDNDVGSMEVTE